jgi:hypothetical protein
MSILEWLVLVPLAFVIYAIVSFLYLRTPNPPPAPAEEAAWLKRITEAKEPTAAWLKFADMDTGLFLIGCVIAWYLFTH